MNLFKKIKRKLNPSFNEWLEDFNFRFEKEMNNPEVINKIKKMYIKENEN